MRKSSGQNRHAIAPYTRVPPPTVVALLFQAGSVGRTADVADEPRVAGRRRIDLALEPGEHARVAQVVARQVLAPQGLRRARRAGPAGPPRRARTRPPRRRLRRRSRSRRTRPPARRARSPPAPRPARGASSCPAAWAGSRAPATSPDLRSRSGPPPAAPEPGRPRPACRDRPAARPRAPRDRPGSRRRSRARPARLDRAGDRRQRRASAPSSSIETPGMSVSATAPSRPADVRRCSSVTQLPRRRKPPPQQQGADDGARGDHARAAAFDDAERQRERVPRGVGRQGVAERAMAVDRAAEAAEERDPERAPEVRRGRQQAGRGPRSRGRRGRDGQLGGEHVDGREPDRGDHRAGHHEGEAGLRPDLGQEPEADRP